MEMFLVGGFVRDGLMGIPSKDVDFCVVMDHLETVEEAFTSLREHLTTEGFKIHVEKPEFLTIRAGIPEGHELRKVARDADFVIAREDGPSSDGRRPDWVRPGDLMADLARRDFSVNAIARHPVTGEFVDPHGGIADIDARILRFVGNPEDRIREDGLRVLRGFRFMVTKELIPAAKTRAALTSELAVEMLGAVSVERIREELERTFATDTLGTLSLVETMPAAMRRAIFRDGLRLSATLAR